MTRNGHLLWVAILSLTLVLFVLFHPYGQPWDRLVLSPSPGWTILLLARFVPGRPAWFTWSGALPIDRISWVRTELIRSMAVIGVLMAAYWAILVWWTGGLRGHEGFLPILALWLSSLAAAPWNLPFLLLPQLTAKTAGVGLLVIFVVLPNTLGRIALPIHLPEMSAPIALLFWGAVTAAGYFAAAWISRRFLLSPRFT